VASRKILTQQETAVSEQLTTIKLPEGVSLGTFRPVAYFDREMDCIRVLTHDRSVTEHRINEFYTVYECNHRGQFDPEYVGFTIKGVRHLFHEVGLPLDRVYKLVDIIDKLISYKPGSIMSVTLTLIFEQYKMAGDLNVDLTGASPNGRLDRAA
jgi:hypothetical protein